jgi:23S rRNA maturation mini-RNase III
MIKLVQALLAGVFFTFILDFFIVLGIKLHYIDHYLVDYLNDDKGLYYNIIFADNQCWILYALFTLFIGYLTTYYNRPKNAAIILSVLFAASVATTIPPIGNGVGKLLLKQNNQALNDQRFSYHGDVYYESRDNIYILDNDLQRIVKLAKKDLKR